MKQKPATKRSAAAARPPFIEDRITHREAAELLGIKPDSLSARYSRNQDCPPRYVYSDNPVYRRSEVMAWIESYHFQPGVDAPVTRTWQRRAVSA